MTIKPVNERPCSRRLVALIAFLLRGSIGGRGRSGAFGIGKQPRLAINLPGVALRFHPRLDLGPQRSQPFRLLRLRGEIYLGVQVVELLGGPLVVALHDGRRRVGLRLFAPTVEARPA